MNTVIITISTLLGAATFLLGRSCIITARLRRINEKNRRIIHNLRCDKERNDRDCQCLTRTLVSLQNPYNVRRKTFSVRELCEGCYSVGVTIDVYGGKGTELRQVTVPIKTIIDDDDPNFARREAEEFKSICEEGA